LPKFKVRNFTIRFPGVSRPRTQFIQPLPRQRQPAFQQPQQQFFSSQGGFQQQRRQPTKPSTQATTNEIFPGLTGHAPRDEITLGTAANVAQFALTSQVRAKVQKPFLAKEFSSYNQCDN